MTVNDRNAARPQTRPNISTHASLPTRAAAAWPLPMALPHCKDGSVVSLLPDPRTIWGAWMESGHHAKRISTLHEGLRQIQLASCDMLRSHEFMQSAIEHIGLKHDARGKA
eukprot:7111964-Prymnesium_polylepis.1